MFAGDRPSTQIFSNDALNRTNDQCGWFSHVMPSVSRIPLIILLLFSLGGTLCTTAVAASGHSLSDSLLVVEHPLVYRSAGLSGPGNPPYIPSDIWSGYDFSPLYSNGINGSGTRIAIVDAYGDPTISKDLSSFDSITKLPSPTLNIFYPDGAPGRRDSGWALETALDVEWAHAIAPGATIDLVVAYDSGLGHIYDGINYVTAHLTNETSLSMSFGMSENQYPTSGGLTIAATHQLFLTMTNHGTSPFASTGDSGSTTCCNVSYPASDPLVIGVGGSTLNLNSSAGYTSETAWSGSGAGSSIVFTKPSWQQSLPGSMRNIADVSYDADPNTGVLVIQGGFEFEVGGTSAGSPQWAGLAALMSQASKTRFGSLNSRLYGLSGYHDVTSGSNGFFNAGTGWDYPTGVGSPNAFELIGRLTGPTVPIHSTSLFLGLNITTTASLQVNTFTSTLSGTGTVDATDSSTGQIIYIHNYTFANVRMSNMSMMENGRLLLNIPVSPNALSVDMSVTIQGTKTTVKVDVTREVNISGGGTVNVIDLGIVLGDYGMAQGSAQYNPQADLLAAGVVDSLDLSVILYYYNSPVFN